MPTEELVVDAAVISMLTKNKDAVARYSFLGKKKPHDPNCPVCKRGRQRSMADISAIKERLMAMTPAQAAPLKEILKTKYLVFHSQGRHGLTTVKI